MIRQLVNMTLPLPYVPIPCPSNSSLIESHSPGSAGVFPLSLPSPPPITARQLQIQ